ncbi:hypothetical protein H9Y05_13375 [Crocinitomicaceae bacterium CZZ-1]|uniref:Uncharacterized protein n=1 Tax=Taishania pollutisoli TaxID=2766479 RepID=A0A8J6U0N1_9FLAO|nr:hypothetical protein [Taishania pollutisoli]MBC9813463.1 hypothetical protein [Taishania pollutisoli]MBX2950650.1 hypothetical protein [Crocinitomicaceae bacterium]NGF76497.1 hypothetical protein [Fluviicola sp. SGL-29]
MKQVKSTTLLLLFTCLFTSSSLFSQVRLPISSGDYKVATDTYYDQVKIEGNKVSTYQQGKLVGTFIVVEERLGQYIMEIVQPGVESVDNNPKRDRKLIIARIDFLTEKECKLSLTQPNGSVERILIQKL